jgi:hypothetical protein
VNIPSCSDSAPLPACLAIASNPRPKIPAAAKVRSRLDRLFYIDHLTVVNLAPALSSHILSIYWCFKVQRRSSRFHLTGSCQRGVEICGLSYSHQEDFRALELWSKDVGLDGSFEALRLAPAIVVWADEAASRLSDCRFVDVEELDPD